MIMLATALVACVAAHLVYSLRLAGRIRQLEIVSMRITRRFVPFRR
jgi:hypothetical protein